MQEGPAGHRQGPASHLQPTSHPESMQPEGISRGNIKVAEGHHLLMTALQAVLAQHAANGQPTLNASPFT